MSLLSDEAIGQPGSGKSTIVKKLRMRFGICISNYEKQQVRSQILSHMRNILIDSVYQLGNWDHLLASIGDIVWKLENHAQDLHSLKPFLGFLGILENCFAIYKSLQPVRRRAIIRYANSLS